ncbi:MAG: tellurite resistance TerB C-terminal domain-containing protein [Collinsella sp.]
MIAEPAAASTQQNEADEPTISTEQFGVVAPLLAPEPTPQRPCPPAPHPHSPTPQKTIFVRCSSRTRRRQHRLWRGRARANMLVDNINEALFDLVGDTVIEFGAAGPQIIEDYEADVRGYLDHE